ncbi:P-selectin [Geodia barretti]|uniref:p-selectin n=1 Tax=Geodia barretti TaxID=519541 RepID=A0AA35QXH6_GEOBA|nr:P-selectin [Geodia barretti]
MGESILTCGADSQWSGNPPVCELVQCPDLSSPMSGSLLISGTGAGVYQETATYACETGFNLVGMSMRVCQSDGTWSGSDPTCQMVMCPTLNDPDNGNLNLSGNSLGDTAVYTCNTGYNLMGESILTCGADSQWSGNPPVCELVQCPDLSSPMSGSLLISGTGVVFTRRLQHMHAKLVSIWLACQSVFVKVMAHGVDLTLHARWLCVPLSMILIMAISTSVETLLEIQQSTHVTLATI